MAYLFAVGAALANALTTILQRLGVMEAPREHSMRLQLLLDAVRRPVWLAGFATMIGGFVFQAAALHYGTLSSVQPVLTLELPFLVAILGLWFRLAVGWREWLGAAMGAGGLAVFLYAASPQAGVRVPDLHVWGMVSFSVVAASAVAVTLARFGPPVWRAAAFGASAAVMFAFTAALIRQVMLDASRHSLGLFLHWPVYAMAAAGLMAVFLAQNAFHAGPVTASQPSLVIIDPLASIGIGVGLFGDRLRTGGRWVVLECIALTVLSIGGLVLARSPVVADLKGEEGELPGARSTGLPPRRRGTGRGGAVHGEVGLRRAGHDGPGYESPSQRLADPAPTAGGAGQVGDSGHEPPTTARRQGPSTRCGTGPPAEHDRPAGE